MLTAGRDGDPQPPEAPSAPCRCACPGCDRPAVPFDTLCRFCLVGGCRANPGERAGHFPDEGAQLRSRPR